MTQSEGKDRDFPSPHYLLFSSSYFMPYIIFEAFHASLLLLFDESIIACDVNFCSLDQLLFIPCCNIFH